MTKITKKTFLKKVKRKDSKKENIFTQNSCFYTRG